MPTQLTMRCLLLEASSSPRRQPLCTPLSSVPSPPTSKSGRSLPTEHTTTTIAAPSRSSFSSRKRCPSSSSTITNNSSLPRPSSSSGFLINQLPAHPAIDKGAATVRVVVPSPRTSVPVQLPFTLKQQRALKQHLQKVRLPASSSFHRPSSEDAFGEINEAGEVNDERDLTHKRDKQSLSRLRDPLPPSCVISKAPVVEVAKSSRRNQNSSQIVKTSSSSSVLLAELGCLKVDFGRWEHRPSSKRVSSTLVGVNATAVVPTKPHKPKSTPVVLSSPSPQPKPPSSPTSVTPTTTNTATPSSPRQRFAEDAILRGRVEHRSYGSDGATRCFVCAADALHNDDHSHVSARTELSLKIESCCRRASTASPLPSNNKKHHSAQPPSKSGATTEGGIVLGGTRKDYDADEGDTQAKMGEVSLPSVDSESDPPPPTHHSLSSTIEPPLLPTEVLVPDDAVTTITNPTTTTSDDPLLSSEQCSPPRPPSVAGTSSPSRESEEDENVKLSTVNQNVNNNGDAGMPPIISSDAPQPPIVEDGQHYYEFPNFTQNNDNDVDGDDGHDDTLGEVHVLSEEEGGDSTIHHHTNDDDEVDEMMTSSKRELRDRLMFMCSYHAIVSPTASNSGGGGSSTQK